MKEQRGFSLIELMIAVAIVGILAAVAFPSYNKSMVKSRRAAAEAYLMEVAQKEQAYLLDARTYTNSLSTLGTSAPAEVSKYYTVAVTVTATAGQPPSFVAKATPSSSKQTADGWLSISDTGAKDSSQSPGKWP